MDLSFHAPLENSTLVSPPDRMWDSRLQATSLSRQQQPSQHSNATSHLNVVSKLKREILRC